MGPNGCTSFGNLQRLRNRAAGGFQRGRRRRTELVASPARSLERRRQLQLQGDDNRIVIADRVRASGRALRRRRRGLGVWPRDRIPAYCAPERAPPLLVSRKPTQGEQTSMVPSSNCPPRPTALSPHFGLASLRDVAPVVDFCPVSDNIRPHRNQRPVFRKARPSMPGTIPTRLMAGLFHGHHAAHPAVCAARAGPDHAGTPGYPRTILDNLLPAEDRRRRAALYARSRQPPLRPVPEPHDHAAQRLSRARLPRLERAVLHAGRRRRCRAVVLQSGEGSRVVGVGRPRAHREDRGPARVGAEGELVGAADDP